MKKELRNVKQGEFVKRWPDALTTYIRGAYDKATKTYALIDTDDISRVLYRKGSTEVYVDFDF